MPRQNLTHQISTLRNQSAFLLHLNPSISTGLERW
nr:MAG TPA: hypothetical protein [Caudoviricetes sp.]